MTENPFTFGNPIQDSAHFIGRTEEIRQITNRLLSTAHESTSLVGEHGIGKTSLLNYLFNSKVADSFGFSKSEFSLVYVDFQGLNDITPQRFWQRILGLIAHTLENPDRKQLFKDISEEEYIDFIDLEDLFDEISGDGTHVILLLDEFEYVTQNPNFNADFFGGLRSLAIHHNLSLVPATRRELVELCHSEEVKGSPFFNIFATVILKPFNEEEIDLFITKNGQAAGIIISENERDFLRRSGGGYPFFMHMAGYYLVVGKQNGLQGKELFNFARSEFAQQAEPHFSYMWSHSSASEKITLVAILALQAMKTNHPDLEISVEMIRKIYARAPEDIKSLTKRGLIVDYDNQISLFSSSYNDWIALELTASSGEEESEESLEAWVTAQKGHDLHWLQDVLLPIKKKYWAVVSKVLSKFTEGDIGTIASGFTKFVD